MVASPDDPLAVLASLYAPPLLVRLTALPATAGWRLEVSEDEGGTWTSFEAGKPGQVTPAQAIEVGAQALVSWKSARAAAHDAEISHFFKSGKLERRKIQIEGEDNLQDGYAAMAEDGTWLEDISPIVAINKAKDKKTSKLTTTK